MPVFINYANCHKYLPCISACIPFMFYLFFVYLLCQMSLLWSLSILVPVIFCFLHVSWLFSLLFSFMPDLCYYLNPCLLCPCDANYLCCIFVIAVPRFGLIFFDKPEPYIVSFLAYMFLTFCFLCSCPKLLKSVCGSPNLCMFSGFNLFMFVYCLPQCLYKFQPPRDTNYN